MSSGACGIIRRSSSPRRIPRTSAAHSSKSSRVVTKNLPLGTAPRQCPERPTLCTASAMAAGKLDREIERALVPDVDDHRIRSSVASQEMCDFFDRLLGCGKPDAHQSRLALRAYGFQSHSLAPQRL